MLQRNNEDNNGAELNYPVSNHHVLDGHANNADGARYSNSSPVANSGPAHSVSRSSLGNYSALLSSQPRLHGQFALFQSGGEASGRDSQVAPRAQRGSGESQHSIRPAVHQRK